MEYNYEDFLGTFSDNNSKRAASCYKILGEYDYTDCTIIDLEQIILNMKPKNLKSIISICYIFGEYAKYMNNNKLLYMIQSLDKKKIWSIAQTFAEPRFISNKRFKEIHNDIGLYEDVNSLYKQTLFKAIYEGIYSEDMSVIKNLRLSDINNNKVSLNRDDGIGTNDIEISEELAMDLKDLSVIDYSERKNRWGGITHIKTVGLYSDSCFKSESRNGTPDKTKFVYYRTLSKIADEYVGHDLPPLNLFLSGIMYRIKLELNKNGITLKEAFDENSRYNATANNIISKELKRSNYSSSITNLKYLVDGFIDDLDE